MVGTRCNCSYLCVGNVTKMSTLIPAALRKGLPKIIAKLQVAPTANGIFNVILWSGLNFWVISTFGLNVVEPLGLLIVFPCHIQ